MLGGLLTLAAMAVFDTLISRTVASLRNLLFIVITSTTCVIMTGLPEVLAPDLPPKLMMLLKATMGPLSGAIALSYLGVFLGGRREDIIVHRITTWGANTLFVSSFALALFAGQAAMEDFTQVLTTTGAITMAASLLATVAAIRAAALGDPLARWMVVACICLLMMVSGLYLRVMQVEGLGLTVWMTTAACTVVYFLIVTVLVIMRTRENRQLARLAALEVGADPATGLPTGSVLISKVEHVFWRTARLKGQCTVVCLNLRNLYELGDSAGHGVEHQILAAMSARIRRAAGFRCVVGLYHPRCFVVVISGQKRRQFVNITVGRLRMLVSQPLSVVGRDHALHGFTPHLGLGVITVNPETADPYEVISDAERQSLGPETGARNVPHERAETAW